jgi:peptide/nickel transport system substrate-binding protein/oligopeptide transport system substrate-binding protein
MKKILLFAYFIFFTFATLHTTTAQDSDLVLVLDPDTIEWNPIYTYSTTEAQMYTAIYEGLVVYDPRTLQPRPGAASRWVISEDKLEYTFTIREDAKYQDGTPVTSQDFKNTWLLMLEQGNESPFSFLLDPVRGAKAFRRGEETSSRSVGLSTPDSKTLVIELEKPAAHFLSILCHQSLVPIPAQFRNTKPWPGSEDLPSNGPYFISEYTEKQIIFEKNPEYWDVDRVALNTIQALFRDEPKLNSSEFNYGSINWILGSFDAQELRIPGSLQINPQFSTNYYFFNARNEPWSIPAVRTALMLFLPMDEIRSTDVYFVPTNRLVPEIPGYPEPESLAAMNIEEGKALLMQAGYPNGEGLPPINILQPAGQESQRIGEVMKKAWESQLQVSVELNPVPYYDLQTTQNAHTFTLTTISWVGDFADPLTFLNMWLSDNPVNLAGYSNNEYERLLEQASVLEGKERFSKLSEAESLLLQSGVLFPISHSPAINVIDLEEIEGWYPNALNIHPFKNMAFASRRAPFNVVSF